MSKPWQPYAVIDKNLPALEESIRAMLAQDHGSGND